MRVLYSWSGLCLVVLLCACGTDASSSAVPSGTQLKDLSRDDLVALCNDHKSRLESLGDPCLSAGLDQSTKAQCEATRMACEQDSSMQTDSIDCNQTDTGNLTDCTVTVGAFESCLDELGTYIKGLSCADVGDLPDVPSCFQSISDECPALFD